MLVAFLKGINLGRRRVRMATLADAFVAMGFEDVSTYVASGNVRFAPPPGEAPADLEARIAAGLEAALGWPVATFVRTGAEVAALAAVTTAAGERPGDGDTLQIGLLPAPPPADRVPALLGLATPTDVVEVVGRELRWLRRGPVSTSKVTTPRVERAAGMPVTFRTVKTFAALAALPG